MPPSRVSVVGTTGTGKTSFAAELAAVLGADHVELDAIHWQAGWTPLERDAFRAAVADRVAGPSWVVDGNYSQVRDLVWEKADTVVWLRYSFPVMFWRLLSRTLTRVVRREPLWNGNRESLRTAFLSAESLFVWQLRTFRKHRRVLPELFADPVWSHLEVVILRRPGAALNWLTSVGAAN